jgi:lysophospholipase L1-like esterase
MKTILCFGDSNTWGYIPGSDGGRAPLEDRWPSVLEAALNAQTGEQRAYQVIAEGLNGRTTVFEEPMSPGKSGIAALPMLLDTHAPLDLVIIMLGTNDTKNFFRVSAEQIARGMECLAEAVARSEAGPVADSNPGAAVAARGHAPAAGPTWPPVVPVPELLIVAPAPIGDLNDDMRPHFAPQERATTVSRGLAGAYRQLAEQLGAGFFDAGPVAEVGSDGVHLTVTGQRALGAALAEKVRELMAG